MELVEQCLDPELGCSEGKFIILTAGGQQNKRESQYA